MQRERLRSLGLAMTIFLAAALPVRGAAPAPRGWSWQESYAEADPQGDLVWKPRPFAFEKSGAISYIDFEAGDDANSGDAPAAPWKHHPWDPQAKGNSAAASGVHTYVFKRGIVYRGRLVVKDAGRPGEPILLTSDPAWGTGEAVLSGSERVLGWKKGATHKDIPEPEKVWWADLDFTPRSVWSVGKDGSITRIPLARTPNWKASNPDDVKSEWWIWDNPRKPFGNTITNARGQAVHLGIDTLHIKDKPEDYFKGALIWPEYGWVMSGPYPTEVEVVDLEQHGLGFSGWTGGPSGGIMRNMRYYT